MVKMVNKAILIFNECCGLFGFRDDESRYVFCNGTYKADKNACADP
jgi:hypothetical protein